MGLNPVQRVMDSPSMEKNFYTHGNARQLTFVPPGEENFIRSLSGSIMLYAPESLTHLSDIDPKKIGKTMVARKYMRDILDRREDKGSFSWTLCLYPTSALARHARMSVKSYSRQVAEACFLNRTEPVEVWQSIHAKIMAIKKRLNRLPVEKFKVESKNIDLSITPGPKRKWLGLSGRNIPSFEVFISPDWRGTKGVFYANQPSFRNGNLVSGVRLEFRQGSVIGIKARKGSEFVRSQLKLDTGACKLGEFSLTDKRFSKINRFMANTLFDENYGGKYGNCHIALGSSYSNTYAGDSIRLNRKLKQELGFNESALHWDLVNTKKKRVTAHLQTGKAVTIYENGRFAY
jgi:aminopeptidase